MHILFENVDIPASYVSLPEGNPQIAAKISGSYQWFGCTTWAYQPVDVPLPFKTYGIRFV